MTNEHRYRMRTQLDELVSHGQRLRQDLIDEQAVLQTRDWGRLAGIADRKRDTLEQIRQILRLAGHAETADLNGFLRQVAGQAAPELSPQIEAFAEIVRDCQGKNRENGCLVSNAMRQTSQMLNFLRDGSCGGSQELYSPSGHTHTAPASKAIATT